MVTSCKSESLVLIDGYNLYHSLLAIEEETGQKVRWLDVRKLSELLLNRIFPPKCPFPHILFFTAHCKHKGEAHVERQKDYHLCLKRKNISVVVDGTWAKKDVVMAHHFNNEIWPLKPYLKKKYKMAPTHIEKGTDVSMAAHLMHLGPMAKWVCVISGDADLMPAIELFGAVYPKINFGLARPFGRETRKMNMKNCTNISPEDCISCLLPDPAPSKKRNIPKPKHW